MTYAPGDLVVINDHETRRDAAPVMRTRIARVEALHTLDDEVIAVVHVLRCFVHVYGYPEKGRYLPTDPLIGATPDEMRPLFVFS